MPMVNERDYEIVCGEEASTLKSNKFAHDAVCMFYPDAIFCHEVKPGCYKFYSYSKQAYIYIKWDTKGDV